MCRIIQHFVIDARGSRTVGSLPLIYPPEGDYGGSQREGCRPTAAYDGETLALGLRDGEVEADGDFDALGLTEALGLTDGETDALGLFDGEIEAAPVHSVDHVGDACVPVLMNVLPVVRK